MIVWDFGLIYFSNLLILWDFWIFWLLLEYDTRFFQCREIGLLCDHQELACTSKDPPRRVDMKEMNLIFWGKNISWVIEKTVWKPTLLTLLENRICALIFWLYWSFGESGPNLSSLPMIRLVSVPGQYCTVWIGIDNTVSWFCNSSSKYSI